MVNLPDSIGYRYRSDRTTCAPHIPGCAIVLDRRCARITESSRLQSITSRLPLADLLTLPFASCARRHTS